MILRTLSINNFKNIAEASLSFSPNINALLGHNGMGKSNLLDAIHYLSFCKSFSGMTDSALIRRGETFTMLRGEYLRRNTPETVTFGLAEGHRKSFKREGKEYKRLSEHIGVFPLVLVSPRDMDLVSGTPEERRRFADIIIAQTDHTYLHHLINYGNALQQRNRLLRDHVANPDLYLAVEAAMQPSAAYITNRRSQFAARFAPLFEDLYARIARTGETPAMTYSSAIATHGGSNSFADLLEEHRRRDEIIGHTTVGPHRDDLTLTLDGMPVRTTASQGQAKTFTIAMRLAQYEFLRDAVGMKPLLLLDDIFDKLDSDRVANIVDIVNSDIFGQIFITDTNRDHLDSIMARTASDYRLWEVTDGTFNPIATH